LETRGGQDEVIWLDNGILIGRTPPRNALVHAFAESGRHSITAMDETGRYDRVEIDIQ
jgi:membrane carboxypeptidase/penicillin-binding protein PbpC